MSDEDTLRSDSPAPPWLVRASLVVVTLFVLIAIGAIGWRWYSVQFPNTAMSIRGSAESSGADVSVSDDSGNALFHGKLTETNQYQLVVLVESGFYHIMARRDGVVLVQDRLFVPSGGGVLVTVRAPPTQPATHAGVSIP
jgi:hypothetical protein